MKQAIFPVLSLGYKLIPFRWLTNSTGERLIVPVYHAVSDHPPAHLQHLYRVHSVGEFCRDLDFLCRYFKPVSMQEVIAMQQGGKVPGNSLHLTFDDGLREAHDIILPILQKKGIPASFFVNPSFIDNRILFYRFKCSVLAHPLLKGRVPSPIRKALALELGVSGIHSRSLAYRILHLRPEDEQQMDKLAALLNIDFATYLAENKPYLSMSQLRKIDSLGFTIGAHGMEHIPFKGLSADMQLQEVKDSTGWISSNFPSQPIVFAFPFTDEAVPSSFFSRLHESVKPPIELTFGTAGLKRDSTARHLQRIPVEKGRLSASRIVFAEYLYYLMKAPFGRNQINR